MGEMWNPFRSKKQAKPVINQAILDRNAALDDAYNMQNNIQAKLVVKKKGKK